MNRQSSIVNRVRAATRARGARASLALLGACVALCVVTLRGGQGVVGKPGAGFSSARAPKYLGAAAAQERDFSTFSHATEAHRSTACAACHRRETNAAEPRLPGHKACTDCHLQQFVASPASQMCSICHTGLDASNPPVKRFPPLRSFNVRFDHAQHTNGAGRSEQGCDACHSPARRGVALTIPAGLNAHEGCYRCHTPGARAGGRDISSCGACHDLARYSRTPTGARAFSLGFSHAAHGARQGLACASCHDVRAGLAQTRQVTSPQPAQHFPRARARSCASCHDNRRAFGGEDFADCKRCHRGTTFRL